MPKENIERAIKRASGKEAGEFEEVIYEGFAPDGRVSIIIEAATDNSLRTTSLVKSIFNKAGAHFAQPGSVSYQFKQVGQIVVDKTDKTFEEIFEAAVESGAEDLEESDNEVLIITGVSEMKNVSEKLSQKGIKVVESEITRIPSSPVSIDDPEKHAKVISFIETLEELDDVQKVYSNLQ